MQKAGCQRLCRHSDTRSWPGQKVKPPKAVNASGNGAVFCKYLGIMCNLKKQVRGRNVPKTRGFGKSQTRGQCLAGCSMLPARLSWGAALVLCKGAAPATAHQEQGGPAQLLGKALSCAHHPAEVCGNPLEMEDQSWGLRLIATTWQQMQQTMSTNGHL